MSGAQCLLLATCALSVYGVGNVWPVQVSSYPCGPTSGRGSSTRITAPGGTASGA
jgi:hypothetical protein